MWLGSSHYRYNVLLPQFLVLNLILLWWYMEKFLPSIPVKTATSSQQYKHSYYYTLASVYPVITGMQSKNTDFFFLWCSEALSGI